MNPQPLLDLLRPQRITEIVDIGANPIDGDPPYKRLLECRLCRVTGFELQQDALQKLNLVKTDLERYFPYAIGDGSCKTLYQCRYSGWTSFFKPDADYLNIFPVFKSNAEVLEKSTLETKKLDEITEVEQLDFLKIDVQGSELDCLKSGMRKLLSCVCIQLEVSFITLYEDQPSLGDLDIFLRSIGFVPHCFVAVKQLPIAPLIVNNDPWSPLNQLVEADIVYVKNFAKPQNISDEQLKHLALISHICYKSFDLALRCIEILEERGVVPNGSVARYPAMIG